MAASNRTTAGRTVPSPAKRPAQKGMTVTRSAVRSEQTYPFDAVSVTATMSSKGQVVIPAKLRRKYRLEEGVTVLFREEDGHIVLEPDRFAALLAFRGTLAAEAETELMEERRKEREREDRER